MLLQAGVAATGPGESTTPLRSMTVIGSPSALLLLPLALDEDGPLPCPSALVVPLTPSTPTLFSLLSSLVSADEALASTTAAAASFAESASGVIGTGLGDLQVGTSQQTPVKLFS